MKNSQLNQIPSIELQLLKWISLVDAALVPDCVNLKRGGSRLWIKKALQNLPGLGDSTTVLTLSSVHLNPRLQGKGWFTGFLDLCDTLTPWSAVYVETVQNPGLPAFLKRQGFIALQHENFYRPTKIWRSTHRWTSADAVAAQALADRAHVRDLLEDPQAVAELALMLAAR